MKRIFRALRKAFRGHVQRARRPRLAIEMLEDRLTPTTTASTFQSIIGLPTVQSLYPYDGKGYTVAVLDTGIDYDDPDLGGGFGPGYRVVAGYNFVNNTANPMDDNGHGTNIAGIIGSSNPSDPGIAPNVNFAALKVLDANMNGSWTAIDNALQWVIANKTKYNIVAINLSLGSGDYTSDPFSTLQNDFSTLDSLGVFTAVASGNNFYTDNSAQGLAYPAISPNVVSVGATWAGSYGSQTFDGATDNTTAPDMLTSFTQRSSALSIVAPGAWITSDGLNNTPLTMGGTSQATAVVTGSAVLLHEALDQTGKSTQATQSNILSIMQSTGLNIVDNDKANDNVVNTGLTFKQINLAAAMATVGQPIALPTLSPIADQTLPVGGTISVNLVANDPSNLPLTYSVKEIYLPAQAYQLHQQYGFTSNGNYYTNLEGQGEKWIFGAGSVWYWILPDGEVHRWTGTIATTLAASSLVGTLDPTYYANPTKLWNAPYAGMPPAVFSVAGNKLSIRAPATWVGTYQVGVTASDGQHSVTQEFNVNEVQPANTPPVLAAIPNQTMTLGQSSLVLTLAGTDASNAALTHGAQVMPSNGQTPAVTATVKGNQLTLTPAAAFAGVFTVQASVSDGKTTAVQTFTVTVPDAPPVLAALANQTITRAQAPLVLTLAGTDANNDPLTYSAVIVPANGQTPAVTATVKGNQLTLTPAATFVGTFTVQATVSDGIATSVKTFTVTVTNAPPTLAAIANQTIAVGQSSVNVTMPANDPDGAPLTFLAAAETPSSTLYQLQQTYHFTPASATYYLNLQGKNEKWLIDKSNNWYAILPTGQIYKWSLTMAQTLTAANLIATVDPSVYADPSLLWNAAAPTPPALTLTWQGDVLTIKRPAGLTGNFLIDVTVSDGLATAKRTFQVTLS